MTRAEQFYVQRVTYCHKQWALNSVILAVATNDADISGAYANEMIRLIPTMEKSKIDMMWIGTYGV